MANSALQSDIAGRKDVRVAGGEQQIAFGGPRSDAGNRGQKAKRLGSVERTKMMEVETVFHRLRDRKQAALLRPRQARFAKYLFSGGKHGLWRQRIKQIYQPAENGIRAGSRDLLRDDDGGEAPETGFGKTQRHLAGDAAHLFQSWIKAAKRIEPKGYVVEGFYALHGFLVSLATPR